MSGHWLTTEMRRSFGVLARHVLASAAKQAVRNTRGARCIDEGGQRGRAAKVACLETKQEGKRKQSVREAQAEAEAASDEIR